VQKHTKAVVHLGGVRSLASVAVRKLEHFLLSLRPLEVQLIHVSPVVALHLNLVPALAQHVSVQSARHAQELIERNLARKHLKRNIVLTMPHFSSVPALIAQSDLIATLPQSLADYQAHADERLLVVKLPAEIASGVEVRQHWHRKFHYDARIKWLRGLIQSTVQHP